MPDSDKNSTTNETMLSIDSQKSTQSDDSQAGELIPKAVAERGYSLGELLGSGGFAKVYRAYKKDKPNEPMACKRFDLKNTDNQLWYQKCLKQEMKLMLKLKHPNIINTFDVIKTRSAGFIFMHLAKDGSIANVLAKSGQPIEEKQGKAWFGQITKAIEFIHSKGIAHRDLKPENFLLDDNKKKVLLTDFGFSCIAIDIERVMKGTNCGTDVYKAPELLKLIDGHVYDAKKVDMYALGVSLFEMLNHNKPFFDRLIENNKKLVSIYLKKQHKKEFKYNKNVKLSKSAMELIDKLLEPEPEQRYTIADVIKHKWLAG